MNIEKPTNTSVLDTRDLEYTFKKIDNILERARENSLMCLERRVRCFVADNSRYYKDPLRWELCFGAVFLFVAFIALLYTNLPWLSGRYGTVQFLLPFIYLGTCAWMAVEAIRQRTKTLRHLKLLTEHRQDNMLGRLRSVRRAVNVMVANSHNLPSDTQQELDKLYHDVEMFAVNNLTAIVKETDNV